MRYTPVRSYQCWDGNPSPTWFKIPRLLSGIAMKKQLGESNLASFYVYIYLQVLGRNKLTVSAITQGRSDLAFSALAPVYQWFGSCFELHINLAWAYQADIRPLHLFQNTFPFLWELYEETVERVWIFLVWFYYIVCGLPTSLYCFGST